MVVFAHYPDELAKGICVALAIYIPLAIVLAPPASDPRTAPDET